MKRNLFLLWINVIESIFVNYITCKKHHIHFLCVVSLKRPPFPFLNWYLVTRLNLKYLCFRVRCERSIHNWKWHFIQDNKTMYIFLSNFWYTLFITTCRMKLECMDMIGLEFYRTKGGGRTANWRPVHSFFLHSE